MNESLSIARVLRDHGLDFVVIGGQAAIAHGVYRNTEDLDIVYLPSPESINQLYVAVASIGGFIITDDIDPVTRLERTRPVTLADCRRPLALMGTDLGYLDAMQFVPGVEGAHVDNLFSTAILIDDVRYASKDWLRRMKLAAGRAIDLKDLRALYPDESFDG